MLKESICKKKCFKKVFAIKCSERKNKKVFSSKKVLFLFQHKNRKKQKKMKKKMKTQIANEKTYTLLEIAYNLKDV